MYFKLNLQDRQKLLSWAGNLGISLSASQIDTIEIYLDELCSWNETTNLTGLTRPGDIVRELILDSMLPALFLPDQGRFLDVGSGAGIPAIPLLICKPAFTATLLEPRARRVDFLRHIIRLTGQTQVQIINKKIEKCGKELHPQGYDMITARALASLKQVIEWCTPHLASNGLLINFQGNRYQATLTEASSSMDVQGLHLKKKIPYHLPGKKSQRNILVFQKNG